MNIIYCLKNAVGIVIKFIVSHPAYEKNNTKDKSRSIDASGLMNPNFIAAIPVIAKIIINANNSLVFALNPARENSFKSLIRYCNVKSAV